MTAVEESTQPAATTGSLGIRQAAFIGVGAMVGAGIFSLLGAAGEVAGSAVWVSFLLAGIVALLQGYSFAKFGSRYPTAGGSEVVIADGRGRHALEQALDGRGSGTRVVVRRPEAR